MAGKIHRTRTRVAVILHSHHHPEGAVELSPDVIGIRSSKTVKGVGGLSIDLVPRRNFFNLIYPNDIINVYIDIGDGKSGFVRTFMGYVDRVERSTSTDDHTGASSTMFRVACSDFMKAFERTNIYFNPNIGNRTDLIDTGLGQSLLAGFGMMTRGVRAHGTPADMVENLAMMLLGFGAQWTLPEAYDSTTGVLEDNKQRRKHRAKARLPFEVVKSFSSLVGDLDALAEANQLPEALKAVLARGETTQTINNVASQVASLAGYSLADVALDTKDPTIKDIELLDNQQQELITYQRAVSGAHSDVRSLLDLIDFSFIENAAIDGYISSEAIWQQSGTLISLMKAFSNELVNELIIDLRPVTISNEDSEFRDSCFGSGGYSKDPDELGYNVNGTDHFPKSCDAVKYVPAIVFREYPYSYTEGLDLSNLYIGSNVGFVPFGPIFSQQAGEQDAGNLNYRVFYNYKEVGDGKSFSPVACQFTEVSEPVKHLDVATITTADVITDSVGRSDADTFNFFAIYATDGLEDIYKFLFKHIMPIATPVSIARNGLRVLESKTRFANYSRDGLCNGESSVDTPAATYNLIRWSLLVDHWNQHNIEYLSGEITIPLSPHIRVGYRLDWLDRKESYYVEGVKHTWQYPKDGTTTLTVSRGQRMDPYPSYIPPKMTNAVDTRFQEPPEELEEKPLPEKKPRTTEKFVWPVEMLGDRKPVISDPFNPEGREGAGHWGADFGFERDPKGTAFELPEKTPLYENPSMRVKALAITSGKVLRAGFISSGGMVEIDYGAVLGVGHLSCVYRHLETIAVSTGDEVVPGQYLGYVGYDKRPGAFQWNHLHLEAWDRTKPKVTGRLDKDYGIDPAPLLAKCGYQQDTGEYEAPRAPEQPSKEPEVKPWVSSEASFVTDAGGGDRTSLGRLAKFFPVSNTRAVTGSRGGPDHNLPILEEYENVVDTPQTEFPGIVEYSFLRAHREQRFAEFVADLVKNIVGNDEEGSE